MMTWWWLDDDLMMTWWLIRFRSHIRRTCGDLIEGDQELKGFSLEHYEVIHNIHASGTFAPLFVSQLTWCTRLIQILLLLSVLMQASILPTMQDAMKVGDMFQLFLFTTQPLQSNHQTCMRRAPSAFFCSFLHYPTLLLYGCSNVVHSKWGVWWTLGEKLFGRRVIYSPWIIANLRGSLAFNMIRHNSMDCSVYGFAVCTFDLATSRQVAGPLLILASPWSPPAWMKPKT